MTYRELAVRDTQATTWTLRPWSRARTLGLALAATITLLVSAFMTSDTVRVRCQRDPTGDLRLCRVVSGPIFMRQTRDLPLNATSSVSVGVRETGAGKGRHRSYSLEAGPPGQRETISGSLPSSSGLDDVARRLNAFLRSDRIGELDTNAGPSYFEGAGFLIITIGASIGAFMSHRRRVRIVIDEGQDEVLVYVFVWSGRTTPMTFKPDPHARFVIAPDGRKEIPHLFFDGGTSQGRHSLCSVSPSLARRLEAVNAALAALPPRRSI